MLPYHLSERVFLITETWNTRNSEWETTPSDQCLSLNLSSFVFQIPSFICPFWNLTKLFSTDLRFKLIFPYSLLFVTSFSPTYSATSPDSFFPNDPIFQANSTPLCENNGWLYELQQLLPTVHTRSRHVFITTDRHGRLHGPPTKSGEFSGLVKYRFMSVGIRKMKKMTENTWSCIAINQSFFTKTDIDIKKNRHISIRILKIHDVQLMGFFSYSELWQALGVTFSHFRFKYQPNPSYGPIHLGSADCTFPCITSYFCQWPTFVTLLRPFQTPPYRPVSTLALIKIKKTAPKKQALLLTNK